MTIVLSDDLQRRLDDVLQSDAELTATDVIVEAIEQYLDGLECPDPDAVLTPSLACALPYRGRVAAVAPLKKCGYPTFDEIVEFVRQQEGCVLSKQTLSTRQAESVRR